MLTFLPHTYRGTKAKVAINSIKVNGQSEVQQRAKWRWTKEGQCQCTPRNMTDIRGNTWPEECREQESLSLLRPGQTRSNLETTWVSVLVWVPHCSAIWRFFAELFLVGNSARTPLLLLAVFAALSYLAACFGHFNILILPCKDLRFASFSCEVACGSTYCFGWWNQFYTFPECGPNKSCTKVSWPLLPQRP